MTNMVLLLILLILLANHWRTASAWDLPAKQLRPYDPNWQPSDGRFRGVLFLTMVFVLVYAVLF